MYSEKDITWSSIVKDYPFYKTIWTMGDNGIPRYTFLDENGKRIIIDKN